MMMSPLTFKEIFAATIEVSVVSFAVCLFSQMLVFSIINSSSSFFVTYYANRQHIRLQNVKLTDILLKAKYM